MTLDLTPDETAQVAQWRATCPFRIVFVARKAGETTVVSAVTSRRIPNRLVREGWQVGIVDNAS